MYWRAVCASHRASQKLQINQAVMAAPEGWTAASGAYNEVERLTLPLAQTLLTRAHSLRPLASGSNVFDNGTGTGILTELLKMSYPTLLVLATDASPGMVSLVESKVQSNGWENVSTRVLDSRLLEGIADDAFTHTLSTFMICLAPEPIRVAREMYRVTEPGGVLGLAVWADAYFGVFNTPFTKACRMLVESYEPVAPMEREWTGAKEVKASLEHVGFRDVDVREERGFWHWHSAEEVAKYFFDGGNPGNVGSIESFQKQGGSVDEVRPLFVQVVEKDYEKDGGGLVGIVLANLITARK